ncbi:MAG: hypothetical protein ACFFGZ_18200 [Candidatus Thorarchaeota archaeon]
MGKRRGGLLRNRRKQPSPESDFLILRKSDLPSHPSSLSLVASAIAVFKISRISEKWSDSSILRLMGHSIEYTLQLVIKEGSVQLSML